MISGTWRPAGSLVTKPLLLMLQVKESVQRGDCIQKIGEPEIKHNCTALVAESQDSFYSKNTEKTLQF